MNNRELGSLAAKAGFRNEDDVVVKFNNWKNDIDAQKWLEIMDYSLEEIENVKAIKLFGFKTDVQIQVVIKLKTAIDIQNLQIKLVSNKAGYNQIDKRWVDQYIIMWDIPESIAIMLKKYTGEINDFDKDNRDKKRKFAYEFSIDDQNLLINWIKSNQSLIVSDILRGQGKFAAEWMLIVKRDNENTRWILKSMNFCLNFFGNGEVSITKRGNIKIAKITVQRKGGDGGRKTANMLQFKINPAELFNLI